jgi:hypothetical protein
MVQGNHNHEAQKVVMDEKGDQQHVEHARQDDSTTSESLENTVVGPADWEDEKPRLNSQMVLAFIVCLHSS